MKKLLIITIVFCGCTGVSKYPQGSSVYILPDSAIGFVLNYNPMSEFYCIRYADSFRVYHYDGFRDFELTPKK